MLPAGRYNRRIGLWRSTLVDDGAGGQTRSWRFLAYRRVSGRPSGGTMSQVAAAMQERERWIFEMRPTDIVIDDRIVLADKNIRVKSVADPDGLRRRLIVLGELEVPE